MVEHPRRSCQISCHTDRNGPCCKAIHHELMDVGVGPRAELALPMRSLTTAATNRNIGNTFWSPFDEFGYVRIQVPMARYI